MDRQSFLLSKAQVPRLHKRQIRRHAYERFEQFMQLPLNNLDKESFCVLLDGIAGTGKTNLVCDFLWSRSDVCGHYFKQIIWLTDRNSDPKNVTGLGFDILCMLDNTLPLDFGSDEADTLDLLRDKLRSYQRPQTMKIMLSKALADCPNTLLILDDVLLPETVDLFANLKCSIIATSTRSEIFNNIDNCRQFHLNIDDVYVEDVTKLCCQYDIDSIGEHSAREIIRQTGGNFALMEKLLISARADTQRLQILLDQLQFGQLNTVKCVSYYQYESLNTCFEVMTKLIGSHFVEDLPALAVLQTTEWIDMEIVSLVWPVDAPGNMSSDKFSMLVGKDMNLLSKHSLVEYKASKTVTANQNDQTRIDPILNYYLLSVADPKDLMNTLNTFKRSLQISSNLGGPNQRTFKKYIIENETSLQQLESILKQPKRKAGHSSNNEPKSTWFSGWITYFWSSEN